MSKIRSFELRFLEFLKRFPSHKQLEKLLHNTMKTFEWKNELLESARSRTWNLLIRSQARCPLRHRSLLFLESLQITFHQVQ